MPGAEECICPGELAKKVEIRLGRSIFFSSAVADVAVEGYIGPRAKKGWVAELVISDSEGKILGSRTLESTEADCRTMDDALALVIAVSIYPQSWLIENAIPLPHDLTLRLDKLFGEEPVDAERDSSTVGKTKEEAKAKENNPQAPIEKESPKGSVYASRSGWRDVAPKESPQVILNREAQGWAVSLVTSLGLGMVSDVTFGLGMVISLQLPNWRPLDMRFNYYFGSQQHVDDEAGSIDVSMLTTNLGLCPLDFGRRESNVRWCIGGGVGSLFASGSNYNINVESMSAFWDLYTGIIGNVMVFDPAALWIGATLEIPINQPQVTYRILKNGKFSESETLKESVILGKLEIGLSAYFF
jgi:hypothetical protein